MHNALETRECSCTDGSRNSQRAALRYVTITWSVVLLNKKYIYRYLKCIVYDKLLKPRQSFRITLYIASDGSVINRYIIRYDVKPRALFRI